MKRQDVIPFSVRLLPPERQQLDLLAHQRQTTRGALLRSLIAQAAQAQKSPETAVKVGQGVQDAC